MDQHSTRSAEKNGLMEMKVERFNLVGRMKSRSILEKAKEAQRLGRWDDAYRGYQMVLRKDERRFGILVQMGHMSKELGNFSRAEAHYAEALELRPEDWDLHVQLGHLHNRAGDLLQAKGWYSKANAIRKTPEITDTLDTIGGSDRRDDTRELRQKTLDDMDSRRFQQALPNALALYEDHGVRDFDVIAGHAYRELGRYTEAMEMYSRYFDRCIKSNSKNLKDAFWRLINILEILEENQQILVIFLRLKQHYFRNGNYSDFGSDQIEHLQSHVGKFYGIFRR